MFQTMTCKRLETNMRQMVMLFGLVVMSSARAASPIGGTQMPTNAILAVEEIGEARLSRSAGQPWVRALSGPSRTVTGVVQEVVCRGVQARIQYGAFEDAAAAHAAALFHLENASALFQTGLWSHAQMPVIGDETWWTRGAGAHALLIRSGNVCALISCRDGDAETRDRVAEEIATRIAVKARTARRITAP